MEGKDAHAPHARACPPSAELRPALLTRFAGMIDKAGTSERIEGLAIRINVSNAFLAASRRDGGALHRFGVFEFADGNIGVMLAHVAGELHAVFVDIGDPEVRELLAAAEAKSRLMFLTVTHGGDTRLMLPPRSEGLELLFAAARKAKPMSASALEDALVEALHFAQSTEALKAVQLDREAVKVIVAHFLITASRYPELFGALKDTHLLN